MCQSSGYLELQLISVENDRGELANGNCCDGARSAQNGLCDQDECDTYLRVCLKEYQVEVTTSGLCTYGTGSSSVIGGNTFQSKGFNGNPNKANDLGTVIIPFQFAWPVGVLLYLFHQPSTTNKHILCSILWVWTRIFLRVSKLITSSCNFNFI